MSCSWEMHLSNEQICAPIKSILDLFSLQTLHCEREPTTAAMYNVKDSVRIKKKKSQPAEVVDSNVLQT